MKNLCDGWKLFLCLFDTIYQMFLSDHEIHFIRPILLKLILISITWKWSNFGRILAGRGVHIQKIHLGIDMEWILSICHNFPLFCFHRPNTRHGRIEEECHNRMDSFFCNCSIGIRVIMIYHLDGWEDLIATTRSKLKVSIIKISSFPKLANQIPFFPSLLRIPTSLMIHHALHPYSNNKQTKTQNGHTIKI